MAASITLASGRFASMPTSQVDNGSRDQAAKGTALIILSAAAFALGGASLKELANDLNPIALVFWRNLFAALFAAMWFSVRGLPRLRTRKFHIHVLRGAMTYGGLVTYFAAITMLPLSHAVLLRASSPLFIPIIAYATYRRLSDRNVWIGVIVGFLGVVCIVKPGAIGISNDVLIGMAAALFGSAAAVCIWELSATDSADTQMLHFTFICLLCSSLAMPWAWQVPTLAAVPSLLLLALLTSLAQALLAMACRAARADKILTWNYTSVGFAALMGYAVWGETLDTLAIVGIALTIIGSHWAGREVN